MKFFVVLSCLVAASVARPNYAFTEVAPLTSNLIPYSTWGAWSSPLAYHHSSIAAAPLFKTAAVATPFVHTGTPVVHAATPVVHAATPVVHAATPLVHHSAAVVATAPAVGLKTQYHAQDFIGQASYGHVEPHQSHAAVQDAAGNKVGSFSYVKPDGSVARTDYVADALGYRVASNDLPVAPVAVHEMPLPVADTPEVMAARAAHMAEVEKVKSRSKRDVLMTPAATTPLVHSPYFHHVPLVHHAAAVVPSLYSSYHVPLVTPSGHIADTPEVTAAKIAHFAEHAAARARGKRAAVYAAAPLAYSHPLTYTTPLAYHTPASTVATSHALTYAAHPFAAYTHSHIVY